MLADTEKRKIDLKWFNALKIFMLVHGNSCEWSFCSKCQII